VIDVRTLRPPTVADPLITVVIPSYNRAGVIGAAIRSVLMQEGPAFELLVVDDGSSDDTLAVVLAVEDPRLGLYQLARNAGAPAARNAGVALARSPLTAFQDSDDEWRPGLLAAHVAMLAGHDVSFSQLEQRYGDAATLYPPAGWQLPASMKEELLATNHISTQTLAVRRAAFEGVGGFDPAMPRFQDWDLVLRLAMAGYSFGYIDQPLAIAYDSPDSLTRSTAKGIAGRERLIGKHRQAYAQRPTVLARHHHVMGSQARGIGDFATARRHLAAAVRHDPRNWKSAAQWLLARLGR
jgi:glycosyltransferase involved in cell wall biosynthesis